VFERFTERARQVVVFAQAEARALKHNYIGTEHLLLGLLREEQGLAARVLESLGIRIADVRAEVARIVGPGEEVTPGQIPFTPRAKKVLELALREGLALGHNYIGTEHVLLGLVRENEGVAARILLDFGADAEKVRNEVISMLSEPGRGAPDFPGPGWMPYAPGRHVRAFASTWSKLSEARDAALEGGDYELSRKLLELEIEEREKRRRVRIDVSRNPSEEESVRTVTLVHHRVADFDTWKQVYDGFADAQQAAGVRAYHVWRKQDDPNMVVVVSVFGSPEAAQALFASTELKDAMERAGVDMSSFRLDYLDEADSGTF
jgi:heme-degrading monooxygenase HmoA